MPNPVPKLCVDCTHLSSERPLKGVKTLVHICKLYKMKCSQAESSCEYAKPLAKINKRVTICDAHNANFVDRYKRFHLTGGLS